MDPNENPFLSSDTQVQGKTNVVVDVLQSVVVAVSISLFLYLFIITPNEVDGDSMLPNFETGQLLFTSKLHAWFSGADFADNFGLNYNRGDVVVFQKQGFDDFVKRVIAVPGDTIAINDGKFIVNGEILDEDFEINNTFKKDGTFLTDGEPPITVGEDLFFVSGDNRDVSFDSRESGIGLIKRSEIKGRVIFRFWPLDSFGYIGRGDFSVVGQN